MTKQSIAEKIATVGPFGYVPKAPGTFGSIPGLFIGMLFGYLNHIGLITYFSIILLLVILFLIAWWAIDITEENWGSHDDKKIVIDEVVGMALVVSFGFFVWWKYLIAFVLFRFFDIKKPSLVGHFDRDYESSFGTLMDDVIAGVFSFACFGIINSIHYLISG